MASDEKLRQVCQQFRQKGIQLDSDWLSGCVEFFIEENPNITVNQLFQQAEEQWNLSDLSDSGVKCLPDSIFNVKQSQIINGKFPLQINYLLDISESPYDQLQKLEKKETEVGKEQPEFKQNYQKTKKQRMLKLELSDGCRTVSALEHKPVPCLTTQLAPGIKLLLTGPMRCVNHILFLEAKNVQILGGDISSMSVDNAYENILRKALNQPINPRPITDYQEAPLAPDTNNTQRARDIPSIPMTANRVIQSNVISSASHTMDDFPDDDFLNEIDLDQITSNTSAEAANARIDQIQSNLPHRRSTQLFDDFDDNDFLNIDSTIEQMAAPQNQVSPPQQQHSEAMRANNDIVENVTLNTSVDPSICSDNYRFKIRGLNLVTIKQLTEAPPQDRIHRKFFIVRAQIDDIIQNARVSKNNKWKLTVLLTDQCSKNVSLTATVNSDVVDKLSGITGFEMSQLAEQREERPQVSEEIAKILEELTNKLDAMDTYMKIAFVESHEHPAVFELIAPAMVLDRKFREKIEYEKLPFEKKVTL